MTVAAAVERFCAASRARERARTRRRARRRRPSARRCSGRSHQADFYRVCCVFLVGSFVFIAHSPHAIERPPLLVTFDRTSRCLGRSSLVLVACREMIRHHLRGRAEEAWCFVSNACFSSVLSYLSRTPLMLLSAPFSSSLPIVLPVSRVSSARSIGVVFFGARSSAAPGWFLLLLLLENEEQPEGSCCLISVSSKLPLRKPKSNSHSEHPA